MNTILKAVLNGERYKRMANSQHLIAALNFLAAVLATVAAVIARKENLPVAVIACVAVLDCACALAVGWLEFKQGGLIGGLAALQLGEEQLLGEAKNSARITVCGQIVEAYSRTNGVLGRVLAVLPKVLFSASSILAAVAAAMNNHSLLPAVVTVTLAAISLSFAAAVLYSASLDLKRQKIVQEGCGEILTEVLEQANLSPNEIDAVKRAGNTHQEFFLLTAADKQAFRNLERRFQLATFLLIILTVGGVLLTTCIEGAAGWEVSLVVGAGFAVFVAAAVYHEFRKRALYKLNALKLDQTGDAQRLTLQREFEKLQFTGNILFSALCIGGTFAGFTAGFFIGLAESVTTALESGGVIAVTCFYVLAAAAFIIYFIIYARYTKRVKPIEMQITG